MENEIKEDEHDLYRNKYRIKSEAILSSNDPTSIFMDLFPESLWETITT